MRKWEDIVKDKMEEFDEALPERVFAEFHAIRNGAAPSSSKRFPLVWVLVPTVAALVAVVLFLRKPSTPDSGIRIIRLPVQPIAAVSDSSEKVEIIQAQPLMAKAVIPKIIRPSDSCSQKPETIEIFEPEEETVISSEQKENNQTVPDTVKTSETKEEKTVIPKNIGTKPVKIKIAHAAGVISGGGLLAVITKELLSSGTIPFVAARAYDPPYGAVVIEPEPQKDKPTGRYTHYFPFKGGLSIGVPVAERLKVTTGLQYSMYQSSFTYTLSGEKKQIAHYLGFPVRLDWTLANNRWLDIYLGGGIEGDYCTGATLAGESIHRDGFSLSLIGVGGIQFNITKRIGFFVEPELSWMIPSESRVLETYRSDYPLMFSAATGLRINLGK